MENLSLLVIIWIGVFLSSYLARRTNLTPILFFLESDTLMINTGILPVASSPFIEGFSKVGIVLFKFALAFEENPGEFVRGIKRSWGIALFGAIGPFVIAYVVALYFWQDEQLAIMCALPMTVTTVSLTMVSLRSKGLSHSSATRGIMASAVLDDIASLALVAIVVPIATGGTEFSLLQVFEELIKAILLFVIISGLGLWVFPHERGSGLLSEIPDIRRYELRDLVMLGNDQSTLLILIVALAIGLLAHLFGFHPSIGAYMAGLILMKDYFHSDRQRNDQIFTHTKEIIDNVAFHGLAPFSL